MTKDEAMRIALEALVNNRYIIESEINLPEALEEVDVAIAVLRQALEQPEREWKGLTDEEIGKVAIIAGCNPEWDDGALVVSVARAIEAKLRAKNGF